MGFNPEPYQLLPAFAYWVVVFATFLIIALVVSLLIASLLYGAADGPVAVVLRLKSGIVDLTNMSWKRIYAITLLTFREAVRRKALLVFVIFAILFMFAGWFLSDTNSRPDLQAKVYITFVLTSISWLVLPVALLLSCWGIPEDIRLRSLHTVVTKPVRRGEVVVGRFLGYLAITTLVLVIMAVIAYVWTKRHVPEEALVCRVPVYGDLMFTDRQGNPTKKGINVGYIWEFRSYIEGASKCSAIWTFNVTPELKKLDELIFEARFESFRTHKGEMKRGLLCRMLIEKGKLHVPVKIFEIAEFAQNIIVVPRKLSYEGKTYDLFKDLTDNGKLKVVIKCLDAGQYVGMAKSDLFIRLPDRPFISGYTKAIFGTWLMMCLIVMLGVTVSCFAKGPVSTLFVFGLVVVGQGFREFMGKLVVGQELGGGPFESVYRLVTHMNLIVKMPDTLLTSIIKLLDGAILKCLWVIQNIVPNFRYFRLSPYVANGFDVPWSAALLPCLAVTCAYILPCLLIGYYSLTLRELEAK